MSNLHAGTMSYRDTCTVLYRDTGTVLYRDTGTVLYCDTGTVLYRDTGTTQKIKFLSYKSFSQHYDDKWITR